MKRLLPVIVTGIVTIVASMLVYQKTANIQASNGRATLWKVQSIDTMKYSRDVAREKNTDASFNQTIEKQVSDIANTGATHVAIGTPYEEEFVPFLKRWVSAARRHNLNVWFRSNVAGWEGWFNYSKVDRTTHTKAVVMFIEKHPDLFEDGDIFTSCTECENGGPGDPRRTGDVEAYRKFLTDEYRAVKAAFARAGKNVAANYYSMNGDVVRLVMDNETTKALDGLVVVDHYVKTPDKLVSDIKEFARNSGGKVVLAEWGAPIPDIHGTMSESKQAAWIAEALEKLSQTPEVVGLNYWTNVGGSTSIWNDKGTPKESVNVLKGYYSARLVSGSIENEIGNPISGAVIMGKKTEAISDFGGKFNLSVFPVDETIIIKATDYKEEILRLNQNDQSYALVLKKEYESIFFRFAKWLRAATTKRG